MTRTLRRSLAISTALLILVGVAILSWESSEKQIDASAAVDDTHETISVIDKLDSSLLAVESSKRAFMLTGDPDALTIYEVHVAELSGVRLALESRLFGHPELREMVEKLAIDIDQRLEHHAKLIGQRQHVELARDITVASLREGVVQSNALRDLIASMLQREHALLAARDRATADDIVTARTIHIAGLIISVAILLVVFSGLWRETRMRTASEGAMRESEERMATLLRSIADGVIATDTHGRITRMNRVAERLTGWPQSEAIGKPIGDVATLVDETTGRPIDNAIARILLATSETSVTHHALLISRGGVSTPVSENAAPITDRDNNPHGVVLVLRDASSEREWADQLRSLNAELEQRVRERTEALATSQEQLGQAQKMEAVGRLAGGIAHDFNNLLSVITSYAELLLDDIPEHNAIHADIKEIALAAQRAAGLTKQLLAFSRRQVLAPRVVDLGVVVAETRNMLARVIGEDIDLSLLAAAQLGKVSVDANQIEQVLMNLAVNARDAMPRGGRLLIALENADIEEGGVGTLKAGRYVTMTVTDTGTGMDETTRARIFEPFFTTKPTGQGTGLGLATVFGIVQQSGGVITVSSTVGVGTTFTIYFPQVAGSIVPRTIRSAGKRKATAAATILVVEDNEQLRSIACSVLTDAGYRVLDAANGVEALALSASLPDPIDLVVTDVVMPKMGGRELSEKLAVERPRARVLFMSGYTDDTILRNGVSDDEIAFLPKPISPHALRDKVAELLEGRRRMRTIVLEAPASSAPPPAASDRAARPALAAEA